MSHRFIEGHVHHTRTAPRRHLFNYRFYLLDIDLSTLQTLQNSLFSTNSFNLFSFSAKDHFGTSDDFMENVHALLHQFNRQPTEKMRFITLPRIMNFVFNPISILLLFEKEIPSSMFVEVHNYNGGRTVYPVELTLDKKGQYVGSVTKNMYVSPFLENRGFYLFTIHYDDTKMSVRITLKEGDKKILQTFFTGKSLPFRTSTVTTLFLRHTLITFWVVTRTLWQTMRLKLKGLKWHSPSAADQIRRY